MVFSKKFGAELITPTHHSSAVIIAPKAHSPDSKNTKKKVKIAKI